MKVYKDIKQAIMTIDDLDPNYHFVCYKKNNIWYKIIMGHCIDEYFSIGFSGIQLDMKQLNSSEVLKRLRNCEEVHAFLSINELHNFLLSVTK